MQLPGRSPANTAMTAMTLDALSGGRFILGLGTSGPQVVEGWHGVPFDKPLTWLREYVAIVRKILAREAPLEFAGERYQIPYRGRRLDRPRQAAQEHSARAEGHPDLHRLDGAQEPGAERRDRRRPAAHLPRSDALPSHREEPERGLRQGGQRQEPRTTSTSPTTSR